jgi:hypothetical protein
MELLTKNYYSYRAPTLPAINTLEELRKAMKEIEDKLETPPTIPRCYLVELPIEPLIIPCKPDFAFIVDKGGLDFIFHRVWHSFKIEPPGIMALTGINSPEDYTLEDEIKSWYDDPDITDISLKHTPLGVDLRYKVGERFVREFIPRKWFK